MNKQNADLSIVIVNFNTKGLLEDCLKSVFAETTGLKFEIFVVDNNSNDGSQEMVKSIFPQVILIESRTNDGFAKANNKAISRARGRYILLLNPDTIVLPGATSALVEFMETHHDAGMAGGQLFNTDGSIQHSIRNFPTLSNQLSECFFLHHIFKRYSFFSEMVRDQQRYNQTQRVDWVCGAVLIVRAMTIDEIGLLDEDFFLYSEEKDWCYRVAQTNWKTYYCSRAKFIHHLGDVETNPKLFKYLLQSKTKFFEKHYGPATSLAFRSILALNLLLRVGIWLPLALAHWPRTKAKSKFRIYWRGLSSVIREGWA